jgi:hypothetical protein
MLSRTFRAFAPISLSLHYGPSSGHALLRLSGPSTSLKRSPLLLAPFNLRDKILAERKKRENERLGISDDPDAEDSGTSMDEEERARIEAEERAHQAAMEQKAREALEERQKADALKRNAFKKFRAEQLSRSETRKQASGKRPEGVESRGRMASEAKVLADDDVEVAPSDPSAAAAGAADGVAQDGAAAQQTSSPGGETPKN